MMMTVYSEPIVRAGDTLRSVEIAQAGVAIHEAISVEWITAERNHAEPEIQFSSRDADAAQLFLRPTPSTFVVEDGARVLYPARESRECLMRDLRPSLVWHADHDLDLISFNLPAAALERWAEEAGVRRFSGLRYESGVKRPDDIITGFGLALLPSLQRPATASRLFVDSVLQTVCHYLARTFGTAQATPPQRGGLASWQERRAKEMILNGIDGQVSLQSLADECRLSVSHFTKAFRESAGETPHQWLLERKLDRAIALMRDGDVSLSVIATTCGFADQSHFTRSFSKRLGVSPGAWRRQNLRSTPKRGEGGCQQIPVAERSFA